MSTELLLVLGALAMGCAGFVAGLWSLRKRPVNPDQVDVDELALEVARLRKLVRREHMSRVRTGESGAEDPSLLPPPELRAPSLTPSSDGASKEELRRRVFQVRR